MEKKPKKNRYVTKTNLYLRIAVAGYVVYLAYQSIPSREMYGEKDYFLFLIAAIFLGVAGLVVVGLSIKGLIRKEYFDTNEIEELDKKDENDRTVN